MTQPIPHWPGRLVSLAGGEQVYVAQTPGSVRDSDNDPVLCVHGMAGAASNWTDFMAELAPEFVCQAIDLPGSGYSPPPKARRGYSIPALAGTVAAFIEQHSRGPVHLVGNSMGGAVSVRLAATRPDLVRTLTLISPALPDRLVHPTLMQLQFPLLAMPKLGEWLMRRGSPVPEQRVAGVVAACFYDPRSVAQDRFAAEVAEVRRRDELGYADAVLIGAARAIVTEYLRPGPTALWRLAGQVRVPVLAIYGSGDQLVNPRTASRAARAFRDVRVIVLPRTGHVAQLEHPALVAARFREMVRRAQGMPGNPARLSRDEVPST